MARDRELPVKNLVPKSYSFDGYNELNCPNSRDKPFFADNVIDLGDYTLTTRLERNNTLSLEFSTVCKKGKIIFKPYLLSFDEYIKKLKKALEENSDFITFDITVTNDLLPWEETETCKSCPYKTRDCNQIRKNDPAKIMAAVSFNVKSIQKSLSVYYGITKGGKATMNKKKIFGMNFELGMCNNSNIASTMMGVAVKNPDTGNWYIFDKAKNTRTNMANIKIGNFPIFLLPTRTLAPGMLIKYNGKFCYVQEITPTSVKLLGAADGVINEIIPEESIIPGMTLYTQVVAFDIKNLTDPISGQNMSGNIMAAMFMMNAMSDKKSEFSLDDINDDSFNGLGSVIPMLMLSGGASGVGSMFTNPDGSANLMALMAMSGGMSGDSDNDGMMTALVLSNLLGNGNTGSPTNPISAITDTFSNIIPGVTASASDPNVVCTKCGTSYPAGTNFCSKCGGTCAAPAAKVCPICGKILAEDDNFCSNCGAVASCKTCPKCGKKVETDDMFCTKCGTALRAPMGDKKSDPEPAEAPESADKK